MSVLFVVEIEGEVEQKIEISLAITLNPAALVAHVTIALFDSKALILPTLWSFSVSHSRHFCLQ